MGLSVHCGTAGTEPGRIREDWLSLEERAQPSVFLSWQWIGTWLAVYKPTLIVLRVSEGERLVGLGLLTESSQRRHGLLVSQRLRLHQTGYASEDQIWIEYNGFLAEKGMEAEVSKAAIDYLIQTRSDLDEIVLSGVDSVYARELTNASALVPHVIWEAPCYGVDLRSLRASGVDFLDTVSGNTRHQVRRSLRRYEALGPLVLERPKTAEEAEARFDSIAPLHLLRWGSGPGQSGFANPDFVRFHKAYLREHWEAGAADLVSLKAGDQVLATFYNLIFRNRVYFYLAGIKPEKDNKLKPGLLGHSLCIKDYMERGADFYDFMGGNDRYKLQLAEPHQQLVQLELQRERWRFRVERAVRTIKNGWCRT
ncbi:GNAT family N-acetyltransferase [Marinobacter sp. F4216]|uniref:GNAT family N-acetyltransferase n=1 Tax=Marinobacter sp. F4216 TaxID=2874281 RepID=UPI001CBB5FA0|nr:GNAT family N-acetyltransferase [Marinobacter sp. F4216]MBZ2167675.1 GNAT family N-acetyltransferase [Marinobacter sp. F4216]